MSADRSDDREEEGDLLAELDSTVFIDNTQYTSSKTFENLRDEDGLSQTLLDNLYKKGYKKPSMIQSAALPYVLGKEKEGKRNLIAQGESGTGKTVIYVLGMFNIVDPSRPKYKAICLEPTRELARQTFDLCLELGKDTGVNAKLLLPDVKLRKKEVFPELVFVGTPGFVSKCIDFGCIIPGDVLMLAVDEADAMLEDNLGQQTARIRASIHPKAKVCLFSATFPDEVKEFASKICPDAKEIILKPSERKLNRIIQLDCRVDEEHDKYNLMLSLFRVLSVGQAIIFTRARRTCEMLSRKMRDGGFPVAMLHGDLSREDRDDVMKEFKEGKSRYLVTTNVVSRGIDVLQVSLVINYDIPMHKVGSEQVVDTETYIHRIGRTARFGRCGVALTLLQDEDDQERMDEILGDVNCESTSIKPDQIPQIEELLKRCRVIDRENRKRLGLDSIEPPSTVEASKSIVPGRRHGGRRDRKPRGGKRSGAGGGERKEPPKSDGDSKSH